MMTYEGKMVPSLPTRQGVYVIRPAGSRTLSQCGIYAIPNPFPPQVATCCHPDHGSMQQTDLPWTLIFQKSLSKSFQNFKIYDMSNMGSYFPKSFLYSFGSKFEDPPLAPMGRICYRFTKIRRHLFLSILNQKLTLRSFKNFKLFWRLNYQNRLSVDHRCRKCRIYVYEGKR